MTRNDKVKKLANAVRTWRGATRDEKYFRAPQVHAFARVVTWLERLDIATKENVEKIVAMTKYEQFDEWIKTL